MSSYGSMNESLQKKNPEILSLLRESLQEYHELFNPITVSYRKNFRLGLFQKQIPEKKKLSVIFEPPGSVPLQTSPILADANGGVSNLELARLRIESRSEFSSLAFKRDTLKSTLKAMGDGDRGKNKQLQSQLTQENLQIHHKENIKASQSADDGLRRQSRKDKVSPRKNSKQSLSATEVTDKTSNDLSQNRKSRASLRTSEPDDMASKAPLQKRGSRLSVLSGPTDEASQKLDSKKKSMHKRGSKLSLLSGEVDSTAKRTSSLGMSFGMGLGPPLAFGKGRRLKKRGSRLRNMCRFIVVVIRMCKEHGNRLAGVLSEFEAIDALVENTSNKDKSELMFNLSDYKSQGEAKVPKEAIRILRKYPTMRTENDLQYLKIALRNYQAITEYPMYMQRQIAERAWFEGYNPKRIVVREGHTPMNFYFILSGNVIVSKYDTSKNINSTVAFYGRGESFGDKAIISDIKRDSTVITKSAVELLVLSADDYRTIFMSGGLGDPSDPFLSSLWYLKGWPIQILGDNPRKANYNFYKRNVILEESTAKTDWIYIIKSGSVSVYKKLKAEHGQVSLPSKTKGTEAIKVSTQKEHKEELRKHMSEYLSSLQDRIKSQMLQPQLQDINVSLNPTAAAYSLTRQNTELKPTAESTRNSGQMRSFMNQPDVAKSKMMTRLLSKNQQRGAYLNSSELIHNQDEADEQQPEELKEPLPQFVILQTLTRGQCFGLADVVYPTHTDYSLVSNGAEVIMIEKKFYMENTTEFLKTDLREKVYPFPTEDKLQSLLRDTVNWDVIKLNTFKSTKDAIELKKSGELENIHNQLIIRSSEE